MMSIYIGSNLIRISQSTLPLNSILQKQKNKHLSTLATKVYTVNVANFEHFLEIPFSDTFVLNPM